MEALNFLDNDVEAYFKGQETLRGQRKFMNKMPANPYSIQEERQKIAERL